jgi:asparagine synthase (glutamine-hydrolysing)
MCGIAGFVRTNRETSPHDEALVHQMCQTIVHRGPDDEGIYAKYGVGLGIRRLSIIDLAGGHQPVHNEDQTIWVVFNGEIYNFPELRRELEGQGHRFYTNTDTEVIVHLYEDYGSECVQKLRGMFAFAIYDERRQSLLLARDRLGIKPLHYAIHSGHLLFGSEIKAVIAAAPDLIEINNQALMQYFALGYIPDPLTAFTHIQKLPPGHLLEFANGTPKIRQYWDLPAYGTQAQISEEECLEELERRLAEAVRIRLIADVPLGALLSGGTDSSVVVALMARASSRPVKTFSIGFRNNDFNELPYARLVANRFGTEHHELLVEPNIQQTLDTLTGSMEEPFGDSSMLPTYYVCCLARKHVTVALSGDGGDELFAGYDRYRICMQRRIFDVIPPPIARWYRTRLYPHLPSGLRGRRFTYNIALHWRERYLHGLLYLLNPEDEKAVFSAEFRSAATGDALDPLRRYFERPPARDAVEELLYVDTKTYLPADILTKVDRMSMATSLEARVPILDHLLVEWVSGLPAQYKMRGSKQKRILRKLAERVGVPREVLYRRKQGFALPLVHWMRSELKTELTEILLEPRTLQRGYFNPKGVKAILDEHGKGIRDRSGHIWQLLLFELWHRNFLDSLKRAGGAPNFGQTPVTIGRRLEKSKAPVAFGISTEGKSAGAGD